MRASKAEAQRVLRDLARVVAKEGLNGQAVWNIVCALRGPDDDNFLVKDATTAQVRFVLAKFAGVAGTPGDNTVIGSHQEWFEDAGLGGHHFRSHIAHAREGFLRLGILDDVQPSRVTPYAQLRKKKARKKGAK